MAWGQTKCTQLNDCRAWQRAPRHHIRTQTCSPRTNWNPEHSTFTGKLIFNPAKSPSVERSRFLANQHTTKKRVTSTASPRSRRFLGLIARFIAANASGRRPVYGTAAAFCSLSLGASGQTLLHQTAQRGLTRARRQPCSHRRWRRGYCRTCWHRPARGWQRRLPPGRRPTWYWDGSPWQAPTYRHR